jgi:GNAT superfamily N-acetyltransferase
MLIKIRLGSENDKQKLLNDYPDLQKFFVICDTGYLIVAQRENDIIGFLWAFKQDIPAPIEAQEIFINAIEVFNDELRCQGIGTQMVQKIIEIAKNEQVYQIRASVQIGNVASHRLWFKNKFSISPVKMPNADIVGSFVSFVL